MIYKYASDRHREQEERDARERMQRMQREASERRRAILRAYLERARTALQKPETFSGEALTLRAILRVAAIERSDLWHDESLQQCALHCLGLIMRHSDSAAVRRHLFEAEIPNLFAQLLQLPTDRLADANRDVILKYIEILACCALTRDQTFQLVTSGVFRPVLELAEREPRHCSLVNAAIAGVLKNNNNFRVYFMSIGALRFVLGDIFSIDPRAVCYAAWTTLHLRPSKEEFEAVVGTRLYPHLRRLSECADSNVRRYVSALLAYFRTWDEPATTN